MNKAASWNINGVGFDAREAAREAARRQGKSLGEWLDDVIADHASDLGVEAHAFGGQDRIDAVTERLERLSRRSGASRGVADAAAEPDLDEDRSRHHRTTANRFEARAPDRHHDDRDDDRDGYDKTPRFRQSDRERLGRDHRDRVSGHRAPHASGGEDTSFLLEDAVEAMDRRAQRAERKTDMALASFARIIDARETKRDDERAMFSALSRKLSDMEARIADRVSDDTTRPIKGALARVEATLETLGRRTSAEGAPRFAPAAVAADRAPIADEPIHRLETKLNTILDALAAKPAAEPMHTSAFALSAGRGQRGRSPLDSASFDSVPSDSVPSDQAPIAPLPFANRRLGAAIADIANHQRTLDRGHAPRRQAAAAAIASLPAAAYRSNAVPHSTAVPEPGPVGGLQGDIAGLSAKIEEMRRDFAARATMPAPEAAPNRIDALSAEVAGMTRLLRDMTPQATVQRQIAQMTAAVDDMRRDVARRDDDRRKDGARLAEVASQVDLAGLKAEIASISKTLQQLAPRESALDATIRGLTDRIETSRERHAPDAATPPGSDIVDELRRWLADIDPRATIGGLEREVRTIGDKLDDLNGVDTSALGRIQNQTEEIRDLLSAAAHPLAVQRIEQQVATLADKIDRQPRLSNQQDPAFQATANDIRALLANAPGTALFDKIEHRLEALTAKVDQAVEEASGARKVAEGSRRHFDQVQEQLAARLAAPTADPAAETSLESLVRDLSLRIEAARAPDASGQAIEALQDQIGRLAGRFDRSDGELSALSSIERSMHGLFAHLEETRASVEAAAAKAAREAANAVMARAAPDGGTPAAIREIAALKAIQADADQRTNQTLNAVHETLEKVVDRLSLMEDDIAARAVRPVPPARPPLDESHTPPQAASYAPSFDPSFDTGRASHRGDRHASPLPDLMLEAADALDAPLFAGKAPIRNAAPAGSRGAGRTAPADLDDTAGRSDFIAAARRAARTAQEDPSVLAIKRSEAPAAGSDLRASLLARTRDYVASHKKPVLLGIAALFVILGTLSVMGSMPAATGGTQVAATTVAPPSRPVRVVEAPVRPAAPTSTVGRATLADLSPSALPSAPPPASDPLPGSDPVTTGSITRLPSFAAQGAEAAAPLRPSGPLKQLADAGNASAQYEIGSRYAEGRQLPKDLSAAADWYERAAKQGLAPAQYKLASLYEKGLGVPRDKARARYWYVKAADAGNPRAMHNLAVLVADGDGKPDYATAVIWFRKAAEYGVHDSQYNLGILLARGLGAPQSLVQSYQWFAVAARQNDADAATKRDEVASKMSPSDLAAAQALATAFHPRTADMAATDIESPAGGWDGASPPSLVKSAKPKLSMADTRYQDAQR